MKNFLKRLAIGIFLALPWIGAASAQQVNNYCLIEGTSPPKFTACSAANPLQVTGSFSATTAGFPGTTQTTGTPIAVTTGGVTGTLPTGTVVVASNVGATNGAYCKLGASATTSDQLIPPNSWFGFTVGSNTQLTCITSTSTTTVNMVGGAGLPTGSGGGGGGSGGASSSFAAAFPSTGTAIGFTDGTNMVAGRVRNPGSGAVIGDAAVVVVDPNVLAAVNAPVPTQSPAVPIGGVSLCDGANGTTNPCTTPATVKAASTPAAATDKALVVDQRPGTTITTATGAADPCQANTATIKSFSITTNTTTNIVTGTSAKKLYVCYLYMQSAAANNVAVISGTTGATCGANTAALVGGTTAANGLNNAANGGQAMGTGGFSVLQVQTNNDDICIITSAATPLAGVIKYVVQ